MWGSLNNREFVSFLNIGYLYSQEFLRVFKQLLPVYNHNMVATCLKATASKPNA